MRSPDAGATFRATALARHGRAPPRVAGPGAGGRDARGCSCSPRTAAATFTGPARALPAGDVRALALSSFFAVDPVLFAAVERHGSHRSADGGATWRPGRPRRRDRHRPRLARARSCTRPATRGCYRSEDAGRTWTPLERRARGVAGRRLLFPLAPDAGLEAFLATEHGVFHTPDGGAHWNAAGLAGQTAC